MGREFLMSLGGSERGARVVPPRFKKVRYGSTKIIKLNDTILAVTGIELK